MFGLEYFPKLTPLDETLMPDQSAVVMVDFQNNFASPKGEFYSLFEDQFHKGHMIENSLNLVKVARELGNPGDPRHGRLHG